MTQLSVRLRNHTTEKLWVDSETTCTRLWWAWGCSRLQTRFRRPLPSSWFWGSWVIRQTSGLWTVPPYVWGPKWRCDSASNTDDRNSASTPSTRSHTFLPIKLDQLIVYYESIKWKLQIKCIYECRCDERLQNKTKEFTRLSYTGLVVELEHIKISTRLIDEKFVNTMGEYVTERW